MQTVVLLCIALLATTSVTHAQSVLRIYDLSKEPMPDSVKIKPERVRFVEAPTCTPTMIEVTVAKQHILAVESSNDLFSLELKPTGNPTVRPTAFRVTFKPSTPGTFRGKITVVLATLVLKIPVKGQAVQNPYMVNGIDGVVAAGQPYEYGLRLFNPHSHLLVVLGVGMLAGNSGNFRYLANNRADDIIIPSGKWGHIGTYLSPSVAHDHTATLVVNTSKLVLFVPVEVLVTGPHVTTSRLNFGRVTSEAGAVRHIHVGPQEVPSHLLDIRSMGPPPPGISLIVHKNVVINKKRGGVVASVLVRPPSHKVASTTFQGVVVVEMLGPSLEVHTFNVTYRGMVQLGELRYSTAQATFHYPKTEAHKYAALDKRQYRRKLASGDDLQSRRLYVKNSFPGPISILGAEVDAATDNHDALVVLPKVHHPVVVEKAGIAFVADAAFLPEKIKGEAADICVHLRVLTNITAFVIPVRVVSGRLIGLATKAAAVGEPEPLVEESIVLPTNPFVRSIVDVLPVMSRRIGYKALNMGVTSVSPSRHSLTVIPHIHMDFGVLAPQTERTRVLHLVNPTPYPTTIKSVFFDGQFSAFNFSVPLALPITIGPYLAAHIPLYLAAKQPLSMQHGAPIVVETETDRLPVNVTFAITPGHVVLRPLGSPAPSTSSTIIIAATSTYKVHLRVTKVATSHDRVQCRLLQTTIPPYFNGSLAEVVVKPYTGVPMKASLSSITESTRVDTSEMEAARVLNNPAGERTAAVTIDVFFGDEKTTTVLQPSFEPPTFVARDVTFVGVKPGESKQAYIVVKNRNPQRSTVAYHLTSGSNVESASVLRSTYRSFAGRPASMRHVDGALHSVSDDDGSVPEIRLDTGGTLTAVLEYGKTAVLGPVVYTPTGSSVSANTLLLLRNNYSVIEGVPISANVGMARLAVFAKSGSVVEEDAAVTLAVGSPEWTESCIKSAPSPTTMLAASFVSMLGFSPPAFFSPATGKIHVTNVGTIPTAVAKVTIDGYSCANDVMSISPCAFEISPNQTGNLTVNILPLLSRTPAKTTIQFHYAGDDQSEKAAVFTVDLSVNLDERLVDHFSGIKYDHRFHKGIASALIACVAALIWATAYGSQQVFGGSSRIGLAQKCRCHVTSPQPSVAKQQLNIVKPPAPKVGRRGKSTNEQTNDKPVVQQRTPAIVPTQITEDINPVALEDMATPRDIESPRPRNAESPAPSSSSDASTPGRTGRGLSEDIEAAVAVATAAATAAAEQKQHDAPASVDGGQEEEETEDDRAFAIRIAAVMAEEAMTRQHLTSARFKEVASSKSQYNKITVKKYQRELITLQDRLPGVRRDVLSEEHEDRQVLYDAFFHEIDELQRLEMEAAQHEEEEEPEEEEDDPFRGAVGYGGMQTTFTTSEHSVPQAQVPHTQLVTASGKQTQWASAIYEAGFKPAEMPPEDVMPDEVPAADQAAIMHAPLPVSASSRQHNEGPATGGWLAPSVPDLDELLSAGIRGYTAELQPTPPQPALGAFSVFGDAQPAQTAAQAGRTLSSTAWDDDDDDGPAVDLQQLLMRLDFGGAN